MSRVWVTGGSGFLGERLVKKLESENHTVSLFQGNVLSPEDLQPSLKAFQPELIYHLAAFNGNSASYDNPKNCIEVNVNGTLNLLEAVRSFEKDTQKKLPTIITSTYYLKAKLSDSPYLISKELQEKVARLYESAYGQDVTIVRLCNVFGFNKRNDTLLTSVAKKMLEKASEIRTGNLSPIRDFMYLDDATRGLALMAAAGKKRANYYELGSGSGVRLSDALSQLGELLSFSGKIVDNALSLKGAEAPELVTDPSAFKEDFQWQPQLSLIEGLKKMISEMQTS